MVHLDVGCYRDFGARFQFVCSNNQCLSLLRCVDVLVENAYHYGYGCAGDVITMEQVAQNASGQCCDVISYGRVHINGKANFQTNLNPPKFLAPELARTGLAACQSLRYCSHLRLESKNT
jgi:hypothetical protein